MRIDDALARLHPGFSVSVLWAYGIANGPSDPLSIEHLRAAAAQVRERLQGRSPAEEVHIAAWRGAFSRFGAKPSKYFSSVEALTRRAVRGELAPVNRLVDHYNAISLTHALPVGGEDLDRVEGGLELTLAEGDESFEGAGGAERVAVGEPVWADLRGITCRRWNWRQASRTRLRPETRNAIFVVEAMPPFGVREGTAGVAELDQIMHRLSPGCATVVETWETSGALRRESSGGER